MLPCCASTELHTWGMQRSMLWVKVQMTVSCETADWSVFVRFEQDSLLLNEMESRSLGRLSDTESSCSVIAAAAAACLAVDWWKLSRDVSLMNSVLRWSLRAPYFPCISSAGCFREQLQFVDLRRLRYRSHLMLCTPSNSSSYILIIAHDLSTCVISVEKTLKAFLGILMHEKAPTKYSRTTVESWHCNLACGQFWSTPEISRLWKSLYGVQHCRIKGNLEF